MKTADGKTGMNSALLADCWKTAVVVAAAAFVLEEQQHYQQTIVAAFAPPFVAPTVVVVAVNVVRLADGLAVGLQRSWPVLAAFAAAGATFAVVAAVRRSKATPKWMPF